MPMKQIVTLICLLLSLPVIAEDKADPGKEEVGQLEVSLIYASSSESARGEAVSVEIEKKLRKTDSLDFAHYRLLGSDEQGILRSYLFWATPVKSKKPIMVSFQPVGAAQSTSIQLDLELWQGTKKILKTDPTLQLKKPLYILGPAWLDGRIIISVELLSLK